MFKLAQSWIKSRRWYPSSEEDFTIVEAWSLGRGVYAAILKAGSTLIYLPLKLSDEKPLDLPASSFLKTPLGYIYEAEFDLDYIVQVFEGLTPLRPRFLEGVGRPLTISPLAGETTNRLVKVVTNDSVLVYKAYRVLDPANREPCFLEYLNGKYAPKLYAEFYVSEVCAAVLMEYVEIEEDAGKAFFDCAETSLRTLQARVPVSATRRVAEFAAGLHYVMTKCEEQWCKPSRVTERDVETWRKRVLHYSRAVMSIARVLLGPDVAYELRARIERAMEVAPTMRGARKIATHQDLHLAQVVNADGKLLALDFEGEPARPERGGLEPAIRDIACVLRSLSYIAWHAGASDERKLAIAKEWVAKCSKEILDAYLSATAPHAEEIHGVHSEDLAEWAREVVEFWLVERGLYEAYYESKYRPKTALIPILGLTKLGP